MFGPKTPSLIPATTEQLVSAAVHLRKQIAALTADQSEIEAKLTALAPGKYFGLETGESVTVVAAAAASAGKSGYKLTPENEAAARKLAGEAFASVFERKVSYVPCEGFAAVVPKLITAKKRALELVQLCLIAGKGFAGRAAYVKYS